MSEFSNYRACLNYYLFIPRDPALNCGVTFAGNTGGVTPGSLCWFLFLWVPSSVFMGPLFRILPIFQPTWAEGGSGTEHLE